MRCRVAPIYIASTFSVSTQRIKINPVKSKSIIFKYPIDRRETKTRKINLFNNILNNSKEGNFLGATIDKDLNYKTHINKPTSIAWRTVKNS